MPVPRDYYGPESFTPDHNFIMDRADRGWINEGSYQVTIGGELYQADVSLKPPYDPSGERIRA